MKNIFKMKYFAPRLNMGTPERYNDSFCKIMGFTGEEDINNNKIYYLHNEVGNFCYIIITDLPEIELKEYLEKMYEKNFGYWCKVDLETIINDKEYLKACSDYALDFIEQYANVKIHNNTIYSNLNFISFEDTMDIKLDLKCRLHELDNYIKTNEFLKLSQPLQHLLIKQKNCLETYTQILEKIIEQLESC